MNFAPINTMPAGYTSPPCPPSSVWPIIRPGQLVLGNDVYERALMKGPPSSVAAAYVPPPSPPGSIWPILHPGQLVLTSNIYEGYEAKEPLVPYACSHTSPCRLVCLSEKPVNVRQHPRLVEYKLTLQTKLAAWAVMEVKYKIRGEPAPHWHRYNFHKIFAHDGMRVSDRARAVYIDQLKDRKIARWFVSFCLATWASENIA